MLIDEEATGDLIRNLDSVKCRIRNEFEELQEYSISDLSNSEKRNVLSNCSDAELLQVIKELGNSFTFVITLFVDSLCRLHGDNRSVLYPNAYALADLLKLFGDYLEISLPNDISFPEIPEYEEPKEEENKDEIENNMP